MCVCVRVCVPRGLQCCLSHWWVGGRLPFFSADVVSRLSAAVRLHQVTEEEQTSLQAQAKVLLQLQSVEAEGIMRKQFVDAVTSSILTH